MRCCCRCSSMTFVAITIAVKFPQMKPFAYKKKHNGNENKEKTKENKENEKNEKNLIKTFENEQKYGCDNCSLDLKSV